MYFKSLNYNFMACLLIYVGIIPLKECSSGDTFGIIAQRQWSEETWL
jgi:hypothetical protein